MPIVLDASVAIVWALADEAHLLADQAMERLREEFAIVPEVWWYEVRNVLIISERRKRLTVEGSEAYLKLLASFSIRMDAERDERAILGLARRYQLTFYDAAYLDVAKRTGFPLATLDEGLRAAAVHAGVSLLV